MEGQNKHCKSLLVILYANCSISLLYSKVKLYILFLLSEALVQINNLSFEGRLLQPASSPQNFYNHTFLQWGLYGFLDGRKVGGTYVAAAAAILCCWKIQPPLAIILRRKQSFRTNEQIYFYLFSLSSSSSSTSSAKDRHQLLLVLPSNRRTRSISSLLLLSQFNSFLKSLKLDSQGL